MVSATRRHELIRSSPCRIQPRLRFRSTCDGAWSLELDTQPDPDGAALREHPRIVDGIPVFPAVAILVLRQEGAPGPARLRVIDGVAGAGHGPLRPGRWLGIAYLP